MDIPSVAVNRQAEIRKAEIRKACLVVVILCTAWFSACGGPDRVAAVPRNSKFSPVFGEEQPSSPKEMPKHPFDLSFLHDEHFACFRVKPAEFLSDDDFKKIQWQDVEAQIAKVLGQNNSQLSKMAAIWLILDQSVISNFGSANGDAGSFVWIVDYVNPVEITPADVQKSQQNNSGLSVKALSDTRLAIGSEAALNKLVGNSSTSELAHLVAGWDTMSAAEGALTIGPIRSFLVSIFEMVSRFGPEAKKLANLPDVVENIQLSVNLGPSSNGDRVLVEGTIAITDEELAKEIVKSLSGLGDSGTSPMSSMFNGGMGAGEAPTVMFKPTSVAAMELLSKEIKDKELFSVQNETGRIVFRLLRPDSLSQVIAATVADGKKQLELLARVESLTRVADAIEAYEGKYGRLPSMNAVTADESTATGIPPQFSWRTAILPFLGEQELYDRFDFAKPWDAEENLAVAQEVPAAFRNDGNQQSTSLQLVAGTEGVYRADRPQPLIKDIQDRAIWTAIAIETVEAAARNWIQPGIVEIDDSSSEDLGRPDENGVLFINAAFKVRAVKKDNELIRKVLTSDGGEAMNRTDFISLERSEQN